MAEGVQKEIDLIHDEIDLLHGEIDQIELQLAENLSWIAKAEHAKKLKGRQVGKLQRNKAVLRSENP